MSRAFTPVLYRVLDKLLDTVCKGAGPARLPGEFGQPSVSRYLTVNAWNGAALQRFWFIFLSLVKPTNFDSLRYFNWIDSY